MIVVKTIELMHFMLHEHTRLNLPDKGIVLVTGNNGEGKSAFIEAVSYALWGKTLRGEDPWADSQGCLSRVDVAGGYSVARQRGKRKATVYLTKDGEEKKYQTASKAQPYIDQNIGAFNLWLRTAVIAADGAAAKFTTATDSERKRLLEHILDLGRFDDALVRCREDLGALRKELAAVERGREMAEVKLDAALRRIADAAAVQSELADPPDTARIAELEYRLGEEKARWAHANDQLREIQHARDLAETLRADHERLSTDDCPTCGQAYPTTKKANVARALAEANAAAHLRATDEKKYQKDRSDAFDEASRVESELQELRTLAAAYEREARARANAQAMKDTAEDEAKDSADVVKTATEHSERLDHEIAVLEQCERVLGLKGVRAQILARSLAGIQKAANAWLKRIGGPDWEVRLDPTREKKTGGTVDAISLMVRHPKRPTWHPFNASSRGQGRRFDVAMVFALADFARASLGVTGGTLFIDEVFDSLDPDGVDRVCDALKSVAQTQCVFVITHNEQFQQRLDPVRHVRVENGTIV